MKNSSENGRVVLIKNVPDSLNTAELFKNYKILKVKRKNDAVLLELENEEIALNLIRNFHQITVENCRLEAKFCDIEVEKMEKEFDSENQKKEHPKIKYFCPPVNDGILINIIDLLGKNQEFYKKVLKLMKKMSLELPFPEILENSEQPCRETDESSEESEIETEFVVQQDPYILNKLSRKRKFKETSKDTKILEKYKRTFKIYKENQEHQIPNPFEKKISLNLPSTLNSKTEETREVETKEMETKDELIILSDEHIKNGKLSGEQLKSHQIFQNYSTDQKSTKLYIKNLAKQVKIEDLQSIFYRYVEEDRNEIEIKLMSAGKMRGQAFVFFKLFDRPEKREIAEKLIEKAVVETNGYLLKNKPIYVCYGKVK